MFEKSRSNSKSSGSTQGLPELIKKLEKHWSRRAAAYQIYPLSFKDSDGDGQGDLSGIIEKLDYIKSVRRGSGGIDDDSLGAEAIWICPFYRSPMADFGYDVEDYKDVDPTFGSLEIFDRLVTECHRRDIKVIVDFVGNHTSSEHPWFVESRSSRQNPKRNWYVWKEPKAGGGPPNNWLSVFGGSVWELDKNTDQYYLHTFLKKQPDLNWFNPEVQRAMSEVIDFWVARGVDGFRIDALQHFIEDEALHDEEPNPNYNQNTDDSYKALVHRSSVSDGMRFEIIGSFLRRALDKHPDIFIVGEVYVPLDELIKMYELCPSGRFMPFNFSLIGAPWEATKYKELIDAYQTKLKPHFLANYVLGNHDNARITTRLGEAESKLVTFLQFTLPGMPFIYYGDEIGMTNGIIPPNAIKDVLANIFPGFHPGRDLERTPMQWDNSLHAGFSVGSPWLPVSSNYENVNVAKQTTDARSTLSLYKSLIRMREKHEVLRLGTYVPRHSNSAAVLSFERHRGAERLLILANFSGEIQREILIGDGRGSRHDKTPEIIFSTKSHSATHMSTRVVELFPYEGVVIRI